MSTSSHILTQRTCGYQHASLPRPSTASSNHICNSPSCPFSKSASAIISGVRGGMMIPGASNPFFFYPTMLRTYYIPRYDVRTRVFLSYNALDQSRPQYALFDKFEIHPEPYHGRALEKWKRIAEEGVDPETKWMVQLRMGNPRLCDMQNVKLSRTILSAEGALCDWKELFSAYFRASAASVAPVTGGVTELTPLSSLHAAAISYVRGTS